MGVDWKANLLRATTAPKAGPEALQRAVKDAIDSGAALEDVKAFAGTNSALGAVSALFADGFMAASDVGHQRSAAVGGESTAKKAQLTSPGMKVHAMRADPKGALPWFSQASLPPAPQSVLGVGGAAVVVDGEHFAPADVADLMRLAA
jgi:hypothetical protein